MKREIIELLKDGDRFLSGQELAERFGVSRTAVWKAIRQLESEGYHIEAVRNKGYHLVAESDRLSAEGIQNELQTAWAGRTCLVLDSVDSTNNEVKRQAEQDGAHGLLIVAEEQTAGRGRRGNRWESKKGDGIFMSLLLRPDIEPTNASMLTLVMGMAVRDGLESVGQVSASIKWPNDIVCQGRKLTGILTEMSAQIDYVNYIVIGVGINVHNEAFPEEVSNVATSIFQQTGKHICRAELIAEILRRFEFYYEQYLRTQDLTYLVDDYNRQLINCGKVVRVLDPKGDYTGIAQGVTPKGELLVDRDGETVTVISGEVSVRGVFGYV